MLIIRSFLGILGLVLILSSCKLQNESSTIEFTVPVTVESVGIDNVEDVIKTTGTIRSKEVIKLTVMTGGLLQIASGKNGRLAEGDKVKAGDLIADITGEDIRLSSKMQVVEQKVKETEIQLAASTTLFKRKLISATALESKKTDYENAKLAYEISIHNDNRSKIVSPIDGIILKLGRDQGQLMANGQFVSSGQVIAEVAALESVIADVDLVGKDIARVTPGLNAKANYYAWQDKYFSGIVSRLSPTIDEVTRSLRAEVKIDNIDLLLKPGMFVEVSLIADIREQVPVIPRRSITQRGGQRVVFVVNGQRAEQRQVELGLSNEVNVEILKGVEVGEKVVILGLETLTDQMPVRITGR